MKSSKGYIAKNEFFEILKAPLFVLRIFGIFPFSFVYQGDRMILQTNSTVTIIVIVLYCRFAFVSCLVLMDQFHALAKNPSLDSIFLLFGGIMIRVFLVSLPALMWGMGKRFEELINNWFQYQVNFECSLQAKMHIFMSPTKNKTRWVLLGLLGPSALITILASQLRQDPWETKFIILYCLGGQFTIIIYWIVSSLLHFAAVDIFLETIQLRFLVTNGFAGLYLHARTLSTDLHTVDGTFPMEILIDVVLTIACFLGFYIYTEGGYQLEKKMKYDLVTEVLTMNLTKFEPAFVNELWTFLRVCELRPPPVTVQNLEHKINRRFLVMISASIFNLLTIFRQLDYGSKLRNISLTRFEF